MRAIMVDKPSVCYQTGHFSRESITTNAAKLPPNHHLRTEFVNTMSETEPTVTKAGESAEEEAPKEEESTATFEPVVSFFKTMQLLPDARETSMDSYGEFRPQKWLVE